MKARTVGANGKAASVKRDGRCKPPMLPILAVHRDGASAGRLPRGPGRK
jgi:hypothetical protein